MSKRPYQTIQEYMEKTGTTQEMLIRRVREKADIVISPAMLSMILRGSRRCSVTNAYGLSLVTGVSFKRLIKWPRYTETDNSMSDAQQDMAVSRGK